MQKHHTQLVHARSLRADILGAPSIWLPRREILLEWLNAFITRGQIQDYELADTEASDLVALELYLRGMSTPVTGWAAN